MAAIPDAALGGGRDMRHAGWEPARGRGKYSLFQRLDEPSLPRRIVVEHKLHRRFKYRDDLRSELVFRHVGYKLP